MFLNNQQVPEEIKREIKKISRNKWQWKHDNSKPMGCSKNSSKKEVYSNTILPQETNKTLNRQPNSIPKTVGKRRRTTTTTKLVEGKYHKDSSGRKWKRNKRNNSKDY